MTAPDSHRYFLVRCDMQNRSGEVSVRYVEHQMFRLWQYLMANKHHLQVTNARLCLWLAESEWAQTPEHLKNSGESDPVTLLRFDLFDSANSIYDRVQRFVSTPLADQVKERLLQRVPAQVQGLPDFSANAVPGIALAKQPEADLTTLGQALSGDLLLPG